MKGRKNKKKSVPERRSQKVFTKPYDDQQVYRLKKLLQGQLEEGKERFYAIKVDGEFCVNKTSNLNLFDNYLEFVGGFTQTIEVVLYFGRSNNCNRHIFYFTEKPPQSQNLQGVDVDQLIKDALKRQKQQFYVESLEKEIRSLKETIKEQRQEIKDLRKKSDLKGILQESASVFGAFINNKQSTSLAGTSVKQPDSEVEVEIVEQKDEKSQQSKEQGLIEKALKVFGQKEVEKMIAMMSAINDSPDFRNEINRAILREKERLRKDQNGNE